MTFRSSERTSRAYGSTRTEDCASTKERATLSFTTLSVRIAYCLLPSICITTGANWAKSVTSGFLAPSWLSKIQRHRSLSGLPPRCKRDRAGSSLQTAHLIGPKRNPLSSWRQSIRPRKWLQSRCRRRERIIRRDSSSIPTAEATQIQMKIAYSTQKNGDGSSKNDDNSHRIISGIWQMWELAAVLDWTTNEKPAKGIRKRGLQREKSKRVNRTEGTVNTLEATSSYGNRQALPKGLFARRNVKNCSESDAK